MVWVWIQKISPKNLKFFNFFSFGSKSSRVKGRSASYLLLVKSKLGSGQDPSLDQGIVWPIPKRFFSPNGKKVENLSVSQKKFPTQIDPTQPNMISLELYQYVAGVCWFAISECFSKLIHSQIGQPFPTEKKPFSSWFWSKLRVTVPLGNLFIKKTHIILIWNT